MTGKMVPEIRSVIRYSFYWLFLDIPYLFHFYIALIFSYRF